MNREVRESEGTPTEKPQDLEDLSCPVTEEVSEEKVPVTRLDLRVESTQTQPGHVDENVESHEVDTKEPRRKPDPVEEDVPGVEEEGDDPE